MCQRIFWNFVNYCGGQESHYFRKLWHDEDRLSILCAIKKKPNCFFDKILVPLLKHGVTKMRDKFRVYWSSDYRTIVHTGRRDWIRAKIFWNLVQARKIIRFYIERPIDTCIWGKVSTCMRVWRESACRSHPSRSARTANWDRFISNDPRVARAHI